MIVTLCSVTVPVHALPHTTPRHQQCTTVVNINIIYNIYRVSQKMSFCGKMAITTFKLIQNAKTRGVLENSGYLLQDGH